MEKKYVIQNPETHKYFRGFYGFMYETFIEWCDSISYAKWFDSKDDIESMIEPCTDFEGMALLILEVWYKRV